MASNILGTKLGSLKRLLIVKKQVRCVSYVPTFRICRHGNSVSLTDAEALNINEEQRTIGTRIPYRLASTTTLTRHLNTSDSRQFRLNSPHRSPFKHRGELPMARRIIVKLGSSVVTRPDNYGLALGRLASIVEQVSELQNEGRELILVTSGAVAFGKQKLTESYIMSQSMFQTLHANENQRGDNNLVTQRAAAAVGQSGLMALYDAMFSQYGVKISQVLVTKGDFVHEDVRAQLFNTLSDLLALKIVPIINTNDAVAPPTQEEDNSVPGVLNLKDNDCLASQLATEIGADTLILMSDVDGIFTGPPGQEGSRLLHTYSPAISSSITFGSKSRVGLGGMESKIKSATWALDHGVSVVICNGKEERAITKIISGKKVGTFFTDSQSVGPSTEQIALKARDGGRQLQALNPKNRADIIYNLAELLLSRQQDILNANKLDIDAAKQSGLSASLLARLALTPSKLQSLSTGLRQIAASSHETLGRVLRRTRVSDGMELQQVTVPIGVLLVIFESRPDCLPQVAALAISTGNGLLLKGGKEASNSNRCLMNLVSEALDNYNASDAIALVSTREEVSDLLALEKYIDLIIPRGSNELVSTIQKKSKGIPVLGHSEGVCHVYVDKEADAAMALKIVRDAKCDYPAACNAMETLLLDRSLLQTNFFEDLCNVLKSEKVDLFSGPRLAKLLTFGPPLAKSLRTEYGRLACTIEVVDGVDDAVQHIHEYGSSHTDVIVTDNHETAQYFLEKVDSACVFHNASSRFADGYRFGLGAEVGISTARIHARGPVGVEGLLTTKWLLKGNGNAVVDFTAGGPSKYVHESIAAAALN